MAGRSVYFVSEHLVDFTTNDEPEQLLRGDSDEAAGNLLLDRGEEREEED